MQARNAARVLPDPVGAEINVVRPARMCGQPCSWGSVGVPKRVDEPFPDERMRPVECGNGEG